MARCAVAYIVVAVTFVLVVRRRDRFQAINQVVSERAGLGQFRYAFDLVSRIVGILPVEQRRGRVEILQPLEEIVVVIIVGARNMLSSNYNNLPVEVTRIRFVIGRGVENLKRLSFIKL